MNNKFKLLLLLILLLLLLKVFNILPLNIYHLDLILYSDAEELLMKVKILHLFLHYEK